MTYVHVDRPISPVFFGSLFPICSRFVPGLLRCTPPLRQFSWAHLPSFEFPGIRGILPCLPSTCRTPELRSWWFPPPPGLHSLLQILLENGSPAPNATAAD